MADAPQPSWLDNLVGGAEQLGGDTVNSFVNVANATGKYLTTALQPDNVVKDVKRAAISAATPFLIPPTPKIASQLRPQKKLSDLVAPPDEAPSTPESRTMDAASADLTNPVNALLSLGKTTIGTMSSLYNLGDHYLAHDAAPEITDPTIMGWSKQYDQAQQDLEHTLHIKPMDPSDPNYGTEFAATILGGIAIPGPKGMGLFRVAEDTHPLIKTAAALANGVTEATIPLRQGKFTTAVVPQLAIGEGLSALFQREINQQTQIRNKQNEFAAKTPYDYMTPNTKAALVQAQAIGDKDTVGHILSGVELARNQEGHQLGVPGFERPQDLPNGPDPVSIASYTHTDATAPGPGTPKSEPFYTNPWMVAALLTVVPLATAGRTLINRMADDRFNDPLKLLSGAGIETQPSAVGVATKFNRAFVQADQALRDVISTKQYGKAQHQLNNAKLDALAPGSRNSKIVSALQSGIMPDSTVKLPITVPELYSATTALSSEDYNTLVNGLLSRTVVTDIHNNGGVLRDIDTFAPTAAQKAAGITNESQLAMLQHMADTVDNHPVLGPIAQLVRDTYRAGLNYATDTPGAIVEPAARDLFLLNRPDYVHLAGNTRMDSNASLFLGPEGHSGGRYKDFDISALMKREGGLPWGGVADPIAILPSYLASLISKVGANKYTTEFIDLAKDNELLKDFVKPATGATPADAKHTIFRDGTQEDWEVSDPSLSAALRFTPANASHIINSVLQVPTRLVQGQITGVFTDFGPTAMAYHGLSAPLTRPPEIGLGLGSELAARAGFKQQGLMNLITRFDATQFLNPVRGMVQMLGEEAVGAAGRGLANDIVRDGLWSQVLGPDHALALSTRLSNFYHNTDTFLYHSLGGGNTSLVSSADPVEVGTGIAQLSPEYAAQHSMRLLQQAASGGAHEGTQAVLALKAAGYKAASLPMVKQVGRGIMALNQIMHESGSFGAFASNLPRINAADENELLLLLSRADRLGGNLTMRGDYAPAQALIKYFAFANPMIQGLAEMGRQAKTNTPTALFNWISVLAQGTAWQYYTLATDPKAKQEYLNMTDQQRGRTIFLPFGARYPVRPEVRMVWGPNTAIMDEISGLNSGKIDPNFVNGLQRVLDSGGFSDQTNFSGGQRFKAGLDATNAFNLANQPILNASAALFYGYDAGMARYTGEPSVIQSDKLVEGQKEQATDVFNGRWTHALSALFGIQAAHVLKMTGEAMWAQKNGVPENRTKDIVLGQWAEDHAAASGPLRDMVFKNQERLQGMNAPGSALWFQQYAGIESAAQAYTAMQHQGVTSGNMQYGIPESAAGMNVPGIQGTAAEYIAGKAAELMHENVGNHTLLANLTEAYRAGIPSQPGHTSQEKIVQQNLINTQRTRLIEKMAFDAELSRREIADAIGDPKFKWQDLDLSKYKNMPSPVTQGVVSMSAPVQPAAPIAPVPPPPPNATPWVPSISPVDMRR